MAMAKSAKLVSILQKNDMKVAARAHKAGMKLAPGLFAIIDSKTGTFTVSGLDSEVPPQPVDISAIATLAVSSADPNVTVTSITGMTAVLAAAVGGAVGTAVCTFVATANDGSFVYQFPANINYSGGSVTGISILEEAVPTTPPTTPPVTPTSPASPASLPPKGESTMGTKTCKVMKKSGLPQARVATNAAKPKLGSTFAIIDEGNGVFTVTGLDSETPPQPVDISSLATLTVTSADPNLVPAAVVGMTDTIAAPTAGAVGTGNVTFAATANDGSFTLTVVAAISYSGGAIQSIQVLQTS